MNTFPTTSTQVVSLESLPFYSYLDDQGFVNFQDNWGKVTVYAIYDAQYQLQYIGKSRDTRTSLLLHLLRQPNDCYYFKYYAVEKPSRTALDQMRQVWMDQMKEQPPVGNVDEFIQSRWEGPIDVQKYGLVTEEEEEQLKQADENDKSKLLKQICRRVQRNIEQELKERGVNELIRWDPKLKEKGLLDGQNSIVSDCIEQEWLGKIVVSFIHIDKLFNQAGCVPVRKDAGGQWQVLLVQSRYKPEIWLFPKGGIEKREKNWEAAVRETKEEAGVCGKVLCKLGKWKGSNGQKMIMFLLRVEQEFSDFDEKWKERQQRARKWLSFDEAENTILQVEAELRRPELLEMLLLSKARLLTLADDSKETYTSNTSSDEGEENGKET
eukprot:jgi/Galph1/4079/GphlegSOOS_G2735.1